MAGARLARLPMTGAMPGSWSSRWFARKNRGAAAVSNPRRRLPASPGAIRNRYVSDPKKGWQ